jgi:hypothetical protein
MDRSAPGGIAIDTVGLTADEAADLIAQAVGRAKCRGSG